MSANKNNIFHWLKLRDNFFLDPKIKKLRKIAGGDTYVCIYLKMMLMTLKTDGLLEFEGIEKTLKEELALKLDEDESNIEVVLSFLSSYGMMEKVNNTEYLLSTVPSLTGKESSSAERVRKHRERKLLQCNTLVTECNEDVTTYIENIESPNNRAKMARPLQCNTLVTECNDSVTECNTNVTEELNLNEYKEVLQCNTLVTECNDNIKSPNNRAKMAKPLQCNTLVTECNDSVTTELELEKEREEKLLLPPQHVKNQKFQKISDLEFLQWAKIKSENKNSPSAYFATLQKKYLEQEDSLIEEFNNWKIRELEIKNMNVIENMIKSLIGVSIQTVDSIKTISLIEHLGEEGFKIFFAEGGFALIPDLQKLQNMKKSQG